MPLFYIFILFFSYSHNHIHTFTIHSSTSIRRGISPFFTSKEQQQNCVKPHDEIKMNENNLSFFTLTASRPKVLHFSFYSEHDYGTHVTTMIKLLYYYTDGLMMLPWCILRSGFRSLAAGKA
jgi:hypothetical protein